MNSSYHDLDTWQCWDDHSWLLDAQSTPDNYEAQKSSQQQDVNGVQDRPSFLPQYTDQFYGVSSHVPKFDPTNTPQQCQTYEESSLNLLSPSLQTSSAADWWPDIFDKVPAWVDPPDTCSLIKQAPRFEGDLYTAPYVKGEGVHRAGWCGFCSSWHKLKDSAFWYVVTCPQQSPATHVFINSFYWYHMHYTHGISCLTGRQLTGPQKMQWNYQFSGWQALCAHCNTWLALGKGDKAAKTTYYRHAYQCQVKGVGPQSERTGGVRKSRSSRRLARNDNSHFRSGHSYP